MATKAKDSSVVGKEKKAPSSKSPITSTKRTTTTTTKPSTTSSTNKPTTGPSEKQIPNYLKPTISSVRLESHSSFKLPRNDPTPTRPSLNRRRSFEPSSSSSRLPKQTHVTHPSLSRQHKALVSPGPRERTVPHRSSSVPSKTSNTKSVVPERLSKTPKGGRTQTLVAKKSSTNNKVSTSTSKKVITDHAASANETNVSNSAETGKAISVEEIEIEAVNEQEVGEVEKVENNQELPHQVVDDSEHEHEHEHDHDHEEHEMHDQKVEEFDQAHIFQTDGEKVMIPIVLEEEEEKDDDNTKQDECNIKESHPGIDHSTTEEEVEVKEKEKEQEQEEEGEKEESGVEIEEDHKSETNKEEEVVEEKKGIEEGINNEEVVNNNKLREGEDDHKDEEEESEVKEEEKVESTNAQEVEAGGEEQGKKESPSQSQVSNDVIEETTGKLLEARMNKVRALAGAFQNAIDHQTK